MLRRNFISNISNLLLPLIFLPQKIFSKNSTSHQLSKNDLKSAGYLSLSSRAFKVNNSIPLVKKRDQLFLSITKFAYTMRLGIYTNELKRKSVLYLEKERITFTADNSFIKLNDQMLQIPLQCFWKDNEVWVPVEYFVQFLNKYTTIYFEYKKSEKKIIIEKTNVNVQSVRLSQKDNGTMIHVFTTEKFNKKDIVLDVRNGWFHIDVYGGKIDTLSIAAVPPAGIIKKVQGFQLGETAALSFKLKKNFLSSDLVFSEENNDFYVNLRTKDRVGGDKDQDNISNELDKQKKKWLIDTIVLDAGHGGKDPGAIGYSKVYEKNLVLPITLKLGELIKKNMPGVKVVYTRKKDIFIPLWKRTKIANDVDSKLFISIHCNSSKSRKYNGFETYFVSADKDSKATEVVLKENSAIDFEESKDRQRYEGVNFIMATLLQSANIKQSQYLASLIQNSLQSKLGKIGMKNRGVKQGPFWVLVGATMPNVLVEAGYISNKHEEKLLKKSTTQKKIAESIYNGIKTYKSNIENAI